MSASSLTTSIMPSTVVNSSSCWATAAAARARCSTWISGIDRPDGGDIPFWHDHHSSARARPHLFRRDHIGFVFQFFNLIPTLSVLGKRDLPQELAGRDCRTVEAAAMTLLDRVGLADRHDAFPTSFPAASAAAWRQARALAHDPLFVLADEPTGTLDDENGRRVPGPVAGTDPRRRPYLPGWPPTTPTSPLWQTGCLSYTDGQLRAG